MQQAGKYLILAGILFIAGGLVFYYGYRYLGWLGRLPGDIRIEKEGMKFYFPIMTCVLLSITASLVLWIYRRFF